jgi:hypothetical protein
VSGGISDEKHAWLGVQLMLSPADIFVAFKRRECSAIVAVAAAMLQTVSSNEGHKPKQPGRA